MNPTNWSAPLSQDNIRQRFSRGAGVGHKSGRGSYEIAQGGVKSFFVVDVVDEAGRIGGKVFEVFLIGEVDGIDLKNFMKFSALGLS